MRAGIWPFGIPVLGIEAAGTVEDDPSGELERGAPVVAVVGGMARTRNGSYAEFVTVPAANVIPIQTTLSWAELAAIPEIYATAWTALNSNLALQNGQSVLIRGATSTVGQAAINIAHDLGAHVIATTRNRRRKQRLHELGAHEVLIDDGELRPRCQSTLTAVVLSRQTDKRGAVRGHQPGAWRERCRAMCRSRRLVGLRMGGLDRHGLLVQAGGATVGGGLPTTAPSLVGIRRCLGL